MSRFRNMSSSEVRELIHALEAAGHTGATSPLLDELSREQTSRMSDDDLIQVVDERESSGKGAGKARAALRQRGYDY